jgi:N-carbamoylputrescine amidase
VIIATVDLAAARAQRHAWGVFRDRRPELYAPLLTLDGKGGL